MSACPVIQSIRVIPPAPEIVAVQVLPPGGAGALQFEGVAGEILSSNCFVTFNSDGEIIRADAPSRKHARGFVKAATALGARCTVYFGTTAGGFTGLNPELPLWLGSNGEATQTPPTTGVCQVVGSPISITRIFVEIQTPFLRPVS